MDFKIGQEVVCIDDCFAKVKSPLKKGQHYIILGLMQGCCSKNRLKIDVGVDGGGASTYCPYCYHSNTSAAWWFMSTRFAPIESIPASHEQAVKELIEENLTIRIKEKA